MLNDVNCPSLVYSLDWPVRTLSFSYDGKMLASASEDHFIDIAHVETGNVQMVFQHIYTEKLSRES